MIASWAKSVVLLAEILARSIAEIGAGIHSVKPPACPEPDQWFWNASLV
jgi:hypothetical protein